ncbi:hypothetical protein RHSIM_Rhsim05G0100500 [Rhododendron simsii]|uniref:NAC domain-containing protein n=1 Tax=Rhododendron simsii TaxID=118357 RepID=A0A834H3H6_RHOSS|nr:hypothetical protein RHSIM_Rhsim05G0100500 [Rhododendron simsii]
MTTVPSGYFFRPIDKQLLEVYLRRKSAGKSLPCDVVIERKMYGAGNKALWQILTNEDPWEICETMDKKTDKLKIEGTIYVFTTLIKASENSDKIIRTVGCGSWHGETALEPGKRDDSKDTKISSRKRKNVEATMTDDDLGVLKPSKRFRTKFVQEQMMECDSAAASEPEVVPFSEESIVQDQSFIRIGDPYEFTLQDMDEVIGYLDEQVPVEEQQESFVLDYDYDDFGNILLTTEVDPSGLALASLGTNADRDF